MIFSGSANNVVFGESHPYLQDGALLLKANKRHGVEWFAAHCSLFRTIPAG
jgi:hypothetical protein